MVLNLVSTKFTYICIKISYFLISVLVVRREPPETEIEGAPAGRELKMSS
jgi:hypothetical protein